MCGKNLRRVHFRKASADGTPSFPRRFPASFSVGETAGCCASSHNLSTFASLHLASEIPLWGSLFFFFFAFHLPHPPSRAVDRFSLGREAEEWLGYGIPGPPRHVTWIIGKIGIFFLHSFSWLGIHTGRPFRLILQLNSRMLQPREWKCCLGRK